MEQQDERHGDGPETIERWLIVKSLMLADGAKLLAPMCPTP
jgi:hypothetical protein